MNFILGIIDDDINQADNYKEFFELEDISKSIGVKIYKGEFESKKILEWIVDEKVECLIIDYNLIPKTKCRGTDLIYYINNNINDFPCILLTAYSDDAKVQQLVNNAFIYDRKIMENGERFREFIKEIEYMVQVFRKRMNLKEKEYEALLNKRNKEELSYKEEEKFITLHRLLSVYGVIEDLPSELLKPNVEKKLDDILKKIDKLTADN